MNDVLNYLVNEVFACKKPVRIRGKWANYHVGRGVRAEDKLAGQGAILVGNTPDEFAAYVRAEIAKWADVVEASGAKGN